MELPARPVTIHRLDVLGSAGATGASGAEVLDVDVVVDCSSGTYIRAIARDLGAALGTGGHLVALRRTRVGSFGVEDATVLDGATAVEPMSLTEATTRCFPVLRLGEDESADIRIGRSVTAPDGPGVHAALAPDGHVLALVVERGGVGRPVLVLDPA